jgi:hypothetical protein
MTAALDDATLDAFAAAGAALLGIQTDPAWQAGIRANLRVSFLMAALVTEFALPDEAEPAPVFVA